MLLMNLNNRSQRLKTLRNEKNKNDETLKSCLCAFDNVEKFVNKKTLIIKWKAAIFESFDWWIKSLLNRSFVNCSDRSNENNVNKNIL